MRLGTQVASFACSVAWLAACSGSNSDALRSPTEEVFGLVAACVPADGGNYQVAPGELIVRESGALSNIKLTTEGGVPDFVSLDERLGVSGLLPGDLLEVGESARTEPVVVAPLGDVNSDAPGQWLLVVEVSGQEDTEIAFTGVRYDLDGVTYFISDAFSLELATQC